MTAEQGDAILSRLAAIEGKLTDASGWLPVFEKYFHFVFLALVAAVFFHVISGLVRKS